MPAPTWVGAVQVRLTDVVEAAVAVRPVTAPGVDEVTTVTETAPERCPSPLLVNSETVTTENVCEVPGVRPVMVVVVPVTV